MILAKGWDINDNSIGTTWNIIASLAYNFLQSVNTDLDVRLERLKKLNKKSTHHRKTFFSYSKKIEFKEGVYLRLSTIVIFDYRAIKEHNLYTNPRLGSIKLSVERSSKIKAISTKDLINRHITKELEKFIKGDQQ
jgi:hypothetical protein